MATKNVGNLNIKLSASTSQLAADLRSASGLADRFAKQTERKVGAASVRVPGTVAKQANQIPRMMGAAGVKAGGAFTRGFGSSISGVSASLGRSLFTPIAMAAGAAGIGIGAGLTLGLTEAVKLAGQLEQTQVAFRVMTGDAQVAGSLIKDLRAFAASTPFTSDEVLVASRQLLAYGFNAKETAGSIRQLGDVAAALSIPMNDMAYLFGTLRAQGRAYTIDIRQFAMRGIPIWEELSKVMDVSVSRVKTLTEEGKVGFFEVAKAFENMTGEGGRFNGLLDQMSRTFLGQFAKLKDNALIALTEVGNVLINDTPMRDWVDTALNGLGNIKDTIQSIKPEIIALAKTGEVYINTMWQVGKQFLAGVRVGLDFFQSAFPEVAGWLTRMTDKGRTWSLSWADAKRNALSFFQTVGPFIGQQIDSYRAVGASIIQGFVIPFHEARIELLRMKEETIRVLDLARGLLTPAGNAAERTWQRLFGGNDQLRKIFDEYKSAQKEFNAAENFSAQRPGDADAVFRQLEARGRLVKAMSAIPDVGGEMAAAFSKIRDPLANVGVAERITLTRRLKELEAKAITETFAGVESSAEKIDRLNKSIREYKSLVGDLLKPEYEGRITDAIEQIRGKLVREGIGKVFDRVMFVPGPGGAVLPVYLAPDPSGITSALDEFRIDPPKVPVLLEEKATDLLKRFESPLTKLRREFDQLQRIDTLGLFDERTFALAVRGAFDDAMSGLSDKIRRLPNPVDPRSSEGISDMLKFQVFGPEGRAQSVPALLDLISRQEAKQFEIAKQILEQLKGHRFVEFMAGTEGLSKDIAGAGQSFGNAVENAGRSIADHLGRLFANRPSRNLPPDLTTPHETSQLDHYLTGGRALPVDHPASYRHEGTHLGAMGVNAVAAGSPYHGPELPGVGGAGTTDTAVVERLDRLGRLESEILAELKANRRELERIRREREDMLS